MILYDSLEIVGDQDIHDGGFPGPGIIVKVGDATPITIAEDQLLDDQVGTGAETPSGAVAELLSQMNMGSPTTSQVASDPPDESQVT